jgi:hypothetical protein
MGDAQFDYNMAIEDMYKHYNYYNMRIIACAKHLSSFKLDHLMRLIIPKVLSTSKFSNQFHNLL